MSDHLKPGIELTLAGIEELNRAIEEEIKKNSIQNNYTALRHLSGRLNKIKLELIILRKDL